MRVSVRQNLLLALVMVVGSVVLWIASLDLKPESAFFPRLLLVIIIGCALVTAGEQVLRMRRGELQLGDDAVDQSPAGVRMPDGEGGSRQSEVGEGEGEHGSARQWLIAVALVLFVLAFVYVGPYTAVFALLVALYVLLSQVRDGKTVLVGAMLALALTAVLYGLFSIGLNVSMPDALLL